MGTYDVAVMQNCVPSTFGGKLEPLEITPQFVDEAAAAGIDPDGVNDWLVQRAVQACRTIGYNIDVTMTADPSGAQWVSGYNKPRNDHLHGGSSSGTGPPRT